jgi:drug/metabolite transporter (DMT)-like permease
MPSPAPLVLTVLGAVTYHLAQRFAGPTGSLWALLTPAYAIAFAVSAGGWLIAGGPAAAPMPRTTWLVAPVLAVAILAVEAGYLLVYRVGWPVSQAAIVSQVGVALLLTLVGVVVLGEGFTATRALGLALSLTGAVLLVRH